MSDLRHALVSSMGRAFKAALDSDGEVHPWDAVADEVIRQMEWSRTECARTVAVGMSADEARRQDMTPAPEGWSPDQK